MGPLHFLHKIAWGSGKGGTSKGSFLWSGNVCGSCGHGRPSLNPLEVKAIFPKILNCPNSSCNFLLLSARLISFWVQVSPSDLTILKFNRSTSRNRVADTNLWSCSVVCNLGYTLELPKEPLKNTCAQILQQALCQGRD